MTFNVDKEIYSLEVLLKTAYSFTDRAYVHLSQDDKNWVINWTEREETHIDAGEFENELIAQQIRERLIEKTMDIRKMMLARAFASSVLEKDPVSSEGFDSKNPLLIETEEDITFEENDILKGWYD